MTRILACVALLAVFAVPVFAAESEKKPAKEADKTSSLKVGDAAPEFQIKDQEGKLIDLAKLSEQGPVLVRLTCGCSGCDKELAYFQEIHEAYKGQGLTSLLVFREPDEKVAKYAAEKKLNTLYAVDSKGASWQTFQTKTMPTNFLIAKGGKIASIAAGCDPSGLLANMVSEKTAKVVGAATVDVKQKVAAEKAAKK
ncbi:MAG: redoxin domain-containing protein [Pirellulaceae bacterium]|nr:redoxin domain-containing protein [Pirellulaceae bacterium]